MNEGEYARAIEEISPAFMKNAMSAYRLFTKGNYAMNGAPVNDAMGVRPQKLGPIESAGKAVGLQPLSLVKDRAAKEAIKRTTAMRTEKATSISNRIVDGLLDNRMDVVEKQINELAAWNKSAKPGSEINMDDIKTRIRSRLQGHKISKRDMERLGRYMENTGDLGMVIEK